MATQPRQQRSRARRDALLDAALTIMLESGPHAVTHRAVAAVAGVPAASTTYYFDSIAGLIGEAMHRDAEQRSSEIRVSLVDSMLSAPDRGEAVTRLAAALTLRDRRRVALRYELYGAAERDPSLKAAVATTGQAMLASTRRSLSTLGIAPESAGEFLAMMEGFAVQSLSNPLDSEREARQIERALRALIIAELAGDTSYEEWSRLAVSAS